MPDFSTVGFSVLVASLCLTAACGGTEDPAPGTGGTGGTTGGAGGSTSGTGGSTAGMGTGGSTAGTGGSTAGSGGSTAGSGGSTAGSGGSTAGTGGSTAGTGGGATDSPSDTSQTGIEGFITAASFKGADWLSGTTGPTDGTSVHDVTQIWYNRTMRQSFADMNTTHTTGSMAVKEIFTGTTVIGHAAMLRTATGWIYYCVASEAGRCTSSSMPNTASYATSAGSCNCHGGGTIVSQEMIPPP